MNRSFKKAWLLERLISFFLLLLFVFAFVLNTYNVEVLFFILFFFILSIIVHTGIGMESIFMDYIHNTNALKLSKSLFYTIIVSGVVFILTVFIQLLVVLGYIL